MAKLTQREKAARYDEIAEYFKRWPSSPYTDTEYTILEVRLRKIINRKETTE